MCHQIAQLAEGGRDPQHMYSELKFRLRTMAYLQPYWTTLRQMREREGNE